MNSGLSGRRILVVEDEVIVAWLLQDMLTDSGCVVVGPAATVAEALAMIEAETIDAAMLDINLNGQKSYPVADVLAARGVPFVFSSGYSKHSLPDAYKRFPLLQKPYQWPKLRAILTGLLIPKGEVVPEAATSSFAQGEAEK